MRRLGSSPEPDSSGRHRTDGPRPRRRAQPVGRCKGVACSAVKGWGAWFCLLLVFAVAACSRASTAQRPAGSPSVSVSPSLSSPSPTASPSGTPAPPPAPAQAPAPPPPPPPPPPASASVSILNASGSCSDGTYRPTPLTVQTNTVVRWTNSSGDNHTATSDQSVFDTGDIAIGATSKGITFSRPGTYKYHCIYHSCMTATITVT